ncbi:hypothetical protein B0H13DRAFT_2325839 [Mycena leptocephala]|nr:hypothetical protein B0H13DRAFT_2325839 [Mycena leptocephala]
MPFPELGAVGTTKGDEMAVPKLNEHQRSWILDIGVRDIDLPGLKGKAATEFYEKVKTDAFEAKAFQHTPQGTDGTEEARLPTLVAAWKQKRSKKSNTSAADDDDASDQEEDKSGRGGLLRGYTKAGWRKAIQKVISNKRAAENLKRKTKTKNNDTDTTPIAEAPALSKLLGLIADDIEEYSKTLTDAINAGAKFRKAEAIMWAEEDQASWEAAAASDEDVDWEDGKRFQAHGRQSPREWQVPPLRGDMLMGWVDPEAQVHLEWVEAVPKDIHVCQTFEKHTPQLVKDSLNAMYAWAEKPLKDYVATLEDSTKGAQQTVTNFWWIPSSRIWHSRNTGAAVASTPSAYYDAEITSRRLASFSDSRPVVRVGCHPGVGRWRRDFRFLPQGAGGQDDEEEDRADEDARRADEAARAADEAKAEAARVADEAKAEARAKVEAARLADEAKAERRVLRGRGHRTSASSSFAPLKKGKGGRKRKAESQLVPEDNAPESAGPARRTTRTRLTPQNVKRSLRRKSPSTGLNQASNTSGPEESGQTPAKLYEQFLPRKHSPPLLRWTFSGSFSFCTTAPKTAKYNVQLVFTQLAEWLRPSTMRTNILNHLNFPGIISLFNNNRFRIDEMAVTLEQQLKHLEIEDFGWPRAVPLLQKFDNTRGICYV